MRSILSALGAATLLVAGLSVIGYFNRAAPDAEAPAFVQWTQGSSQRYEVSIESSLVMILPGDGSPQSTTILLDALLDIHVLAVDPNGALVGVLLSAVELEISGDSSAEMNRVLTQPFRVRYRNDGTPAALEFPGSLEVEHRQVLENLVKVFQVKLQEGDTWTVQESNQSGTYEAVYTRRTAEVIDKTKRRFLTTNPAMGSTELKVASSETIRIDASRDWVVAMTVNEKMTTTDPGFMSVEITNHAVLELLPAAATVTVADPETWEFVATEARPAHRSPGKAAVPALSPQEAEKEIRLVVKEINDSQGQGFAQISRLRDLILIDEKLPLVLLDLMREEALVDQTRADLYHVFELAGTPKAQAALGSVIEDTTWSSHDALRAIVALGGVEEPTPDALQVLWNMASSGQAGTDRAVLESSSVLALGSLGSAMRISDDPGYESLRGRLISGVRSASDDHMRSTYLRALGSTGDSSLVVDVVAMLDDPVPRVREASAETLGRLGPNEVADDLVRQFDQETDSAVRGSIAKALTLWEKPTQAATESIQKSIRTERDEDARFKMVQFLGAHITSFPEHEDVLRALSRTEPSQRIRQSIAEMLATASR